MKLRLGLVAVFAVVLTATALADKRSDAKAEVEFGVQVARKGLWNEATLRFEGAVAIDPTYASAWNNLAIGCEQLGRFEDARKAYERAMKLDPKNEYIRGNYESFREIYDRQKRAGGR
jgi:Flp pilus assembly protein TadD